MVRARVALPVGIAIAAACAFVPGQITALTDGEPARPSSPPPPAVRADDVHVRSPAAVLARRAELRAAHARARKRRAAHAAPKAAAPPPAAPPATTPARPAPASTPPAAAGRAPAHRPPTTPPAPARSTAPAQETIPFDDSG